jgi:hypothetical protein
MDETFGTKDEAVTRFDHRGESPWKRAGTAAGAERNPRVSEPAMSPARLVFLAVKFGSRPFAR